jgi:hypothetical protein
MKALQEGCEPSVSFCSHQFVGITRISVLEFLKQIYRALLSFVKTGVMTAAVVIDRFGEFRYR